MRLRFVVIAMLSAGMAAKPQMAKAADLTGRWVAEITEPSLLEPAYAHITLQRTGDSLSGLWGATTVKGSVAGSDLKLQVTDAEGRLLVQCPGG